MNLPIARTQLIQQLLTCSNTAAKLACKLSTDNAGYEDLKDTCSEFKAMYEFALSRFGSAIRAARGMGQHGGLPSFSDQQMEEKQIGKGDKAAGAQPEEATDKLGLLIDKLVHHLAGAVEHRIQVEVVPGIRYDSVSFLEEVLPDVEDRILRRLEDRLGMYKGSHPIYATLCSVLARRLADMITRDVEERVYSNIKDRLMEEFEDELYARVKARRAAQSAAREALRDGRKRSRLVKEEES